MLGGEVVGAPEIVEPDDVVEHLLLGDEREGREHPDLEPFGEERRLLGVDPRELGLEVLLREEVEVHVHHLARPVVAVEVHHHLILALHLREELLLVREAAQLAVALRQPLLALGLPSLHRLQALPPDVLQVVLRHVVHLVQLVIQGILHLLRHAQHLLLHHLLSWRVARDERVRVGRSVDPSDGKRSARSTRERR